MKTKRTKTGNKSQVKRRRKSKKSKSPVDDNESQSDTVVEPGSATTPPDHNNNDDPSTPNVMAKFGANGLQVGDSKLCENPSSILQR